jgi:NitT/TauT family transport system substrate-binding protein
MPHHNKPNEDKMFKKTMTAALLATTTLFGASMIASAAQASQAQAPSCSTITPVKLGISIYVGWQPWYWANQTGALKAAGARHCLDITVTEFPSYGPSLDAFAAKQVDALVITNMDTLMSRVGAGLDSTVVIVGDYSNGNDAVLSKDFKTFGALKGQIIYRAQNTVTDYLIERALQQNGMTASDIKLENLDDSAHVSGFAQKGVRNLGTWNPMTLQLQRTATPRYPVNTVFNSASIPGEIQDLLVVDTDTLKANPEIGDAFAEVWYQAMAVMNDKDAGGKFSPSAAKAVSVMASTASSTLPEYLDQLKTTHMYYSAKEAAAFTDSAEMVKVTREVRDFCYARGLMGEGNTNPNAVGISFSNGTVLGDKSNIKFRFDSSYMKRAAEGKLR